MNWRLAGGIVLGLITLSGAKVAHGMWHLGAAGEALVEAGYGERVTRLTYSSRCGVSRSATEFVGKNMRRDYEARGYVCTSYFGQPEIHELPLSDHSIDLDWD